MIKPGTWVVMEQAPRWVSRLPEASQRVFRFCIGKAYKVVEIDDQGLCVLDVSRDVDAVFGGFMNDIRVEPKTLRKLTLAQAQSMRRAQARGRTGSNSRS